MFSLNVDIKGYFPFEAPSTLITCERLLSSVNSHVAIKVSLVNEAFSTLLTNEVFLF